MSPTETAAAVRPSRSVRLFASHEEQEAETLRYWSSRTMDQRLEALAEILRDPFKIELTGDARVSMPEDVEPGRVTRLFKDREEQEAWNERRMSHGKRP